MAKEEAKKDGKAAAGETISKALALASKTTHAKVKVLVIDVGGTNVKMLATGQDTPRKYPSGPAMTAAKMVQIVKKATEDWDYDVRSEERRVGKEC